MAVGARLSVSPLADHLYSPHYLLHHLSHHLPQILTLLTLSESYFPKCFLRLPMTDWVVRVLHTTQILSPPLIPTAYPHYDVPFFEKIVRILDFMHTNRFKQEWTGWRNKKTDVTWISYIRFIENTNIIYKVIWYNCINNVGILLYIITKLTHFFLLQMSINILNTIWHNISLFLLQNILKTMLYTEKTIYYVIWVILFKHIIYTHCCCFFYNLYCWQI